MEAENNPKLKAARAQREARDKANGGGAKRRPQEPAPVLYPDLYWIWATYCYLSERRGVSANGPVPITVESMNAYAQMTNRYRQPYLEQLLHFIPVLDRAYLSDFYEKQRKEMEKQRKKSEQGTRRGPNKTSGGIGRR